MSKKRVSFGETDYEVVESAEDTNRFKIFSVSQEVSDFLEEKVSESFKTTLSRYKKCDDSVLDYVKNLDPEHSDLAGRSSGQLVIDGNKFLMPPLVEEYLSSINFNVFDNHRHGPIFYYPPNGGYMGWHTNCKQSRASYRAFFTKGSGYFQYLEDGKIYRVYDSAEWKCNVFFIGDCSDPTWHSIWGGNEGRHSVGYMVEKSK